jgi:hypothetical protein
MKCEFTGCKCEAKWRAEKLFGKGGAICTCDKHKPDASKRSEKTRNLPFFYKVTPIEKPGRMSWEKQQEIPSGKWSVVVFLNFMFQSRQWFATEEEANGFIGSLKSAVEEAK